MWFKVKLSATEIFAIRAVNLYSYNTNGTNVVNLVFSTAWREEVIVTLTVNAGREEEVINCINNASIGTTFEDPFVLIMDLVTGYKICPDITSVSVTKREL